MLQIAPQEQFPIVRKLADANDTGTYYVQAVVRDSVSGVIIKIDGANQVNLTDGGNQRFSKVITAPTDVSGTGKWIDITTTVYEDSGYTTPSSIYGNEVETYLVAQRFNPALLNPNMFAGVGGQGPDIDYKKIRALFLEAVSQIEAPEFNAPNYSHEFEVITRGISAIKIEKPEPVDLSPVLKAISEIEKPEKVDFQVVIDEIDNVRTKVDQAVETLTEKIEEGGKETNENVKKECEELMKLSDSLTKFLSSPKLELTLGGNLTGEANFKNIPKLKEEPEPEPDLAPARAAKLLRKS